ncbi:hypothetical protein HID58_056791 [Brassica napus]|uniref:Autophagy-related protein n=3 Tax=Brassica TaxID=3705 RepID=A0ABQ8AP84_BRANA|nr:hypothetical protein HID58_056791 [Brassica napus]CAF1710914.1 unnamed protein product [Brassica napus]CDY31453.1 BnaC03g63710D [Brassica napus]VDC99479.1 unnamed protein product [Brassica oleracea]
MIFACLKFADSNIIAKAKSSFKLSSPLEARMGEATRMREKYPDRIPVIMEKAGQSDLPDIDKNKYLVPADLTVGQFKYVVRKRVKPGAEILVFVNNTLIPPNAALMSAIYEKHKDEDGLLYMTYCGDREHFWFFR